MTGTAMNAAEHMDQIYRYQRHIYDLTRKPYLLGRGRLIAGLDVPPGGTVLEIACGTGRNLIQIARRYPHARLFGFDVSEEMLATAAANVRRAGLQDRITLAHADAAQFDGGQTFGQPIFDRIVISYALSMIPVWREVLPRAYDLLGQDGALHIVDFGQQAGLPQWFKALLFAWLGRFSVAPRADMLPVLDGLCRRRGARLHFEALYRGYAHYAMIRR